MNRSLDKNYETIIIIFCSLILGAALALPIQLSDRSSKNSNNGGSGNPDKFLSTSQAK